VIRRPRRRRLPVAALAAVLVAAILGGCAPYSGTTAQKVRQWVSQNSFRENHDLVITDINDVDMAVRLGAAKTVRTICGGMAVDLGTAYETLPTPDQALTNDLNAADTTLAAAATSCSGVGSVSSPTMTRDLALFRTGIGDLRKAQRVLASLGVSWKIPPVTMTVGSS